MANSGSPDSSDSERTDFLAAPAPKYSQTQLEDAYAKGGVLRARTAFEVAQKRGRAGDTSPGQHLLASFALILSRAIRDGVAPGVKGQHSATVSLLRNMTSDGIALLVVRRLLNLMLAPDWALGNSFRTVAYQLGTAVHEELCAQQFADMAPGLFYSITRDLGRQGRLTDKTTVRATRKATRRQALPVREWELEHRHIIGVWLLDQLVAMGMVLKHRRPEWRRTFKTTEVVFLSKRCLDHLDEFQASLEYAAPAYGPSVNEPLPYGGAARGGWYTEALHRRHPSLVRGHPSARQEQIGSTVFAAVNAMQSTPWRVNKKVLAVLRALPDHEPEVEPPAFERTREYAQAYAHWYRENLRRIGRVKQRSHALAVAKAFLPYDQFYFVWYLDTRGRMYPFGSGITPQGADIERGLLEFAEGGRMTMTELPLFLRQGAGLWGHGVDKLSLPERQSWIASRIPEWVDAGRRPEKHQVWRDAEQPVSFLAWCIAMAEWQADQSVPIRVPVGSDATCSGLQHLAALSRDPVLAKAVNLLPGTTREDAYAAVAKAVNDGLRSGGDLTDVEQRLLRHGIPRSWVKPAVMNYSYGITKMRYAAQVAEDHMDVGARDIFPESVQVQAAAALARRVWQGMESFLGGSQGTMRWLQAAIRSGEGVGPTFRWETPSGFLAAQSYYATAERRVRTAVLGMRHIRVLFEADKPAPAKAAQAFPANYVQSMDAAHAHLTAAAMPRGSQLAFVHDSFSTSIDKAALLSSTLRDTFAAMYAVSPLTRLPSPTPPTLGDWDHNSVRESDYFFS